MFHYKILGDSKIIWKKQPTKTRVQFSLNNVLCFFFFPRTTNEAEFTNDDIYH